MTLMQNGQMVCVFMNSFYFVRSKLMGSQVVKIPGTTSTTCSRDRLQQYFDFNYLPA